MTRPPPLLLLVGLASCGGQSARQDAAENDQLADRFAEVMVEEEAASELLPTAAAPAPRRAKKVGGLSPEMDKDEEGYGGAQVLAGLVADMPADDEAPGASAEPARTRAWFPETFLWVPQLETNAAGVVTVDARVPDRLTEWRVMALANSADGGLGGAVTRFQSALPVSVEPVVPPLLRQGDRVRLPVQVTNQTRSAQQATVTVRLTGAVDTQVTRSVSLSAGATQVVWVDAVAARPGVARLRAELGADDAVERTFTVVPDGRPLTLTRGGTLGGPRDLPLQLPPNLDPAATTVRLAVYPGALALLRQELAAAADRGGVAGTGYALQLAGVAPEVLARLGQPVGRDDKDPDAARLAEQLRTMRIRATARAAQASRSYTLPAAVALAAPALHHDDPLLERLGDRLVRQLAEHQRPDGTFGGDGGGRWTVQRLLVATAEGARAVQDAAAQGDDVRRAQLARRVTLLATGAVERNGGQLTDGYTAAAVLAAGLVEGERAAELAALVEGALTDRPDGTRVLPVEAGVMRPDGSAPTTLEATALAALALQNHASEDVLADLGGAVLGAWRPGAGWGDGQTDARCLAAVLALFDAPLPTSVTVQLSRDGAPLKSDTLDAQALRDLVVLEVPDPAPAGLHTYGVTADPPLPGLGFSLAVEAWVPWETASSDPGLELRVAPPAGLRLGERGDLVLTVAAPAGRPLSLDQGLPAGVVVDEDALSRAVVGGTVTSFRAEDGLLHLDLPRLSPGQVHRLTVPVTPTLSGVLSSGATEVAVVGRDDQRATLAPTAWVIGG